MTTPYKEPCRACEGSGLATCPNADAGGFCEPDCDVCDGTDYVDCEACDGSGEAEDD